MPSLSGSKWGASTTGTTGGVVTWSLVGAGRSGVTEGFNTNGFGLQDDRTSNGQVATGFDVLAALQSAFQSWADVADIEFVQVADGGERVLDGHSADIRVAFGHIDGASGRILGKAFFPTDDASPRAGDILIDEDEFGAAFLQDLFIAVAAHEIGHSIGLGHVNDPSALLNPIVGQHTTPQSDDIQGARQIYGAPRDTIKRLVLDEDTPDVRIVERRDGLNIRGSSESNSITGAAGAEEVRGLAGDDRLTGAGGADSLFGGTGDDFLRGGGGLDRLLGNGGEDTLIGGGRSDFLKGGGGADQISGGGGADTLNGNGREDTLDGGRGDDVLRGGAGADVFKFSGGQDIVLDFAIGVDRIDATAFGDIADLAIADTADGAAVSAGAKTLVLQGVAADQLSDDQFIFAGDQEAPGPVAVVLEMAPEDTGPDQDGVQEFDAAPRAETFHDDEHGDNHVDDQRHGHDDGHGDGHDDGHGDEHDDNHAHELYRPNFSAEFLL